MANPWNSLEIAKLIVSSLTPILVVVIGFILNRNIKKIEKKQWTNQKIVEKRLDVYDKIVPILNDIFCFHCYIGSWKEISAKDIIEYKRVVDKEINVYSPLFPLEIMENYNEFISQYYETNTGWGKDAKIKSLYSRRKQFSRVWDDSYIDLFSGNYIAIASQDRDTESSLIESKKTAYIKLVNCLSNNIEIMKSDTNCNIDNPNINFHLKKRV